MGSGCFLFVKLYVLQIYYLLAIPVEARCSGNLKNLLVLQCDHNQLAFSTAALQMTCIGEHVAAFRRYLLLVFSIET